MFIIYVKIQTKKSSLNKTKKSLSKKQQHNQTSQRSRNKIKQGIYRSSQLLDYCSKRNGKTFYLKIFGCNFIINANTINNEFNNFLISQMINIKVILTIKRYIIFLTLQKQCRNY
ncbi:unnamed protein product [Paramecium sonneborni]|uniref:Uncharacterized protein n=1 Tax=Paramecium sonneborni TaxID=65129 RepID=A0A8S1K624_9CILI|nr:unnamed protein product [Paramecium sonneborni]